MPAGDRVAVVIHLSAVGRSSGIAVDTRYAHVWTMRDGRGVASTPTGLPRRDSESSKTQAEPAGLRPAAEEGCLGSSARRRACFARRRATNSRGE